jgi:hypothetical protein
VLQRCIPGCAKVNPFYVNKHPNTLEVGSTTRHTVFNPGEGELKEQKLKVSLSE